MGLEEAEGDCGEAECGWKRLREIVERQNGAGRG